MKSKQKSSGKPGLRVTVDGKQLDLPEWLANDFPAVQSYISNLVIKQERVLWSLCVDGATVDLSAIPFLKSFSRVQAKTISFTELALHLIAAGRSKISQLRAAIHEAVLLIVINDHRFAAQLWREWQPRLRDPLFSMRALQELKAPALAPILDGAALAQHLEHAALIHCEIESIVLKPETRHDPSDLISLSEVLERSLLPWLEKLAFFFDLLDNAVRQSTADAQA